jgi:hypothetical protein
VNVLTVVVALSFFKQYLLLLGVNQMAAAVFRFVSGAGRNMIVANVFASLMLLVVMVLGGFIIVRGKSSSLSLSRCNYLQCKFLLNQLCFSVFFLVDKVKKWLIWGYWISPMMYAQNAISVNEMLGHSWDKILNSTASNETLGVQALKSRGLFTEAKWYWIGFGAMIGFTILFNALFTLALTYLKRE